MGLPLIVDSTFSTPYLTRPIDFGADIVVHSLTKWLGGHGAGIGGIVVDSGKFNWAAGKHPLFDQPDPSYHGLRWGHDLPAPLAYILRMRTGPLRNPGACLSPDNAWIALQGIETLPQRMEHVRGDSPWILRLAVSGLPASFQAMARQPRFEYPGAAYHVMTRGGGGIQGQAAGSV